MLGLSLVAILNACGPNGPMNGTSDSGGDPGFFFDDDGEPTSNQFYAIDIQGYEIINFDDGLKSDGDLDYSELDDGDYIWETGIVEYNSGSESLVFNNGNLWDSEDGQLNITPYSSSTVNGLSWNETPYCENLGGHDADEEELTDLLNDFLSDCGEQLLVYDNGSRFTISHATNSIPSDPDNISSEVPCVLGNDDYCGQR